MQACIKSNSQFVNTPFTEVTKKNKHEAFPIYSNEHREVRRGNTAMNELVRRAQEHNALIYDSSATIEAEQDE